MVLLGGVERLDNISPVSCLGSYETSVNGHVLMTCEQYIKFKLLTYLIPHILGRLGKSSACVKVSLKTAVIYAYINVGLSLKL